MKAMILAAGRGERMRPLTDETPKALLRAGRKTLIEYHLESLQQAGITDVVINLAWLGDKLRTTLGNGERYGVTIEYSHESPAALETGGGICRALPLLGPEPFWIVNGDVHTDYTFEDGSLADDELGRLILVANPDHNPAGDFGLEGGRIQNSGAEMYTYSGLAVLRPELFNPGQEGAFPLAPLLRNAADSDSLAGELYAGVWIDVGTPARLAQVKEIRAY
jgi:MurNAc alpha-1-phosphate uridylyltransferase